MSAQCRTGSCSRISTQTDPGNRTSTRTEHLRPPWCGKGDDGFGLTDVAAETLRTFALTHNYNRWILSLLAPYLGHRILEVGCGLGNMTYYLRRFGKLTSIDVNETYLRHLRLDYSEVEFVLHDIADKSVLELSDRGFDTAVCINVLEHIGDDAAALSNIRELLTSGGRLLIFVPAIPKLYNQLDRTLAHHRRYSGKGLGILLAAQGFCVERIVHNNMIGAFGWFLNGAIQKRRQLSVWQTLLFDRFVPIVARLEQWFPPRSGMSLLAVAHKP